MTNKFNFTLSLIISNLVLLGQTTDISKVTSIEKDIVYLKLDSSLFSGVVKEFYPNKVRKLSAHYKDGYHHGKYKKWHNNHRIYIVDNYKNGYKHGVCKKTDVNGKKIIKKKYLFGELLWEKDYMPVVPIESYY